MFANSVQGVCCDFFDPSDGTRTNSGVLTVGVGHENVYSPSSYQQALSLCRDVQT
jgi:hypothetical protein